MPTRCVSVEIRAPDGSLLRLRGRVGEVLLALAVHLAAREDALNRTEAWSVHANAGRADCKINFGDNVKPVEFRSDLGA